VAGPESVVVACWLALDAAVAHCVSHGFGNLQSLNLEFGGSRKVSKILWRKGKEMCDVAKFRYLEELGV